ncbi:MurR/RpiR family transcriptional regulator [Paenarthrobacter aurescens]|uniref:MurR/RpiR family transcriptional regulator n=1 Tax=Paenarthrobacter aurescens TaxID=43663 RepID=UPI0021C073C3|nr:MurR/RpiR family transcriptional regulator [Paenarthrobacter aurescens]MCT9868359.1 MurR/RpiR family transcriptional regulator [Paenarthrobacter aurescens]
MQVEELHSERNLKRTIANSMDSLSKGERKVARALLASYPAAGLSTVAQLAGDAGVSPPTVLRFATRLGYSGFPDLQKALVHEINEGMGSPLKQYDVKEPPTDESVLDRARDVFHSSIESTFSELSRWEFDRLVRFLSDESREVRIVGGRFSRLLADYLASHLQLIRPRIQLIPRDELPRLAAVTDAGPSTLLIAYDYRRYDEVTAQFVAAMRAKGATIALMTDNWLSPVAKSADIVVTCRVEAPSPFDSLVPATALTEAIIAAVTDSLGDRGRSRLEAVEASAEAQEAVL